MVKTLPFGSSGLKVNSPGFGAMGLSFGLGTNLKFKQAEPVLLKAIELGCTFWDTAVVYAAGINESLPRNLPSLNTIPAIANQRLAGHQSERRKMIRWNRKTWMGKVV